MTRLCKGTRQSEIRHAVVSLTGRGAHAKTLEDSGIDVICMGIDSVAAGAAAVIRLARLLRSLQPDVVQTWMYHADLIGGIAARMAGVRAVVWGLRSTAPDHRAVKGTTWLVIRACAALSSVLPAKIIVCAGNSVAPHVSIGYRREKMVVIHNGFDFAQFKSTGSSGEGWREANGIDGSFPLLGAVARFTPQKDHLNLLRALALLRQRGENFRCALIGQGMDASNPKLRQWLVDLELERHVILMGHRTDVREVMEGLDLHVISSRIEGFPNVLAEAMACGTPCVSTDVGDAERIVAEHGWIVPREDPAALSAAISAALAERSEQPERWSRRRSGGRKHVERSFALDRMVEKYVKVWREVLNQHR